MENNESIFRRIKNIFIGKARDIHDSGLFHNISLIAFFAWIGLGADGLSSSCYGPEAAYLALNSQPCLSIFVAIATVVTILIISASYSQIVEVFPSGGGGYVVASKLLSPNIGMVSGCALLIDYVLTITISVASGADAIFSLLPLEWHSFRLPFALAAVILMIILNMRGVKESVLPLVPIFITFIVAHAFIIIYAIVAHIPDMGSITTTTGADISSAVSKFGLFGVMLLVLRAYTLGAGTYTGLEAVSNGLPVLRDPKEETAKSTMRYMAISLSLLVFGLMLAYLFYKVTPVAGKTLNTVFFEKATANWGTNWAYTFILITLVSEATLLLVAAQTGFLGGPRVLANMALDRWFPTRFSTLSDRLVTQNGILIIGGVAVAMMFFTRGSVRLLVVLYSINVFITFALSQLGMVRHWWRRWTRGAKNGTLKKLAINSIGFVMSTFILISMILLKFNEGGWVTLAITLVLIIIAVSIKRHYRRIMVLLRRLNPLVAAATEHPESFPIQDVHGAGGLNIPVDPETKTAILVVNGFNGMGLHILLNVIRLFGGAFKNFIFVEIGVIDVGNFKGRDEMDNLKAETENGVSRYVDFMNRHGYHAEGIATIGVNIVDEIVALAPKITERFPNSVFFGGQLIFEKESLVSKIFHNYTVFTLQKQLYRQGVPFVILPVRV